MSRPVKASTEKKGAAWIFLLYLGFLVYWILAVAGTSARQIAIDRVVSLPILSFKVSLNIFFISMPAAAVLLFMLLPWKTITAKDLSFGLLARSCRKVVRVLLWLLFPLCLIVNALWHLRSHQPAWTTIISLTIPVGVIIAIWCIRFDDTGQKRRSFTWKAFISAVVLFAFTLQCIFLFLLIPWTKVGSVPIKVLYGTAGDTIQSLIRVDLSNLNLAAQREAGSADSFESDLSDIHLEGAILTNSILKGAELRGAHLRKAKMMNSVLDRANLSGAMLAEVNLAYASAQGADFSQANMIGICLREINLQDANLSHSDIRAGSILYVDARRADFTAAKFENSNIFLCDFREANLSKAYLKGVSLTISNLSKANLAYADLQNTYLWKVNFDGADLTGTNLLEARELEIEQLVRAKTLYKARLDPDMLEMISKSYPHLLKKPVKD